MSKRDALQETAYASKAHFDFEVGILRKIWIRLQKVRSTMLDLRSREAYRPRDETAEETTHDLPQYLSGISGS